ncbi:MAG: hypothetical protein LBW85_01050 [Deltaproteobacteria bacterium]|jgi:ribonuclease J|nr:hypothetical protein [Deltaproteobacteria bacterium]
MRLKLHRGPGRGEYNPTTVEFLSDDGCRIFIDLGSGGAPFSVPGLTEPDSGPKGSALFLSHLHNDHSGRLEDCLEGIDVYAGSVTAKLMRIIEGKLSGVPSAACGRRGPGAFPETGPGEGRGPAGDRRRAERLAAIGRIKTFDRSRYTYAFGGLTVTRFLTDHSCLDTYMFLVKGDGAACLVTGDFRDHGLRWPLALNRLKAYAPGVTHAVCMPVYAEGAGRGEGERAGSRSFYPESDVRGMAERFLKTRRHVFVVCSSTDLDRIHAFMEANAAQEGGGRLFLADSYQARILKAADGFKDSEGKPFGFRGRLEVIGPGKEADYARWDKAGFLMLARGTAQCFKTHMTRYLGGPGADPSGPGGAVIYSRWRGYLDPGRRNSHEDRELLKDWLRSWPAREFSRAGDVTDMPGGPEAGAASPESAVTVIHTGGHASPEALKRLADEIFPDAAIIPIEHDSADGIMKLFPEKGKVIPLEPGRYLELERRAAAAGGRASDA